MLGFDLTHLARDKVQSLVPGSRNQLAVFTHEGSRQPPVAVEVAPALATFNAGLTLAARVLLVPGNLGNDPVFYRDAQAAADAAEAADRARLSQVNFLLYRGGHPDHSFALDVRNRQHTSNKTVSLSGTGLLLAGISPH